jgi:outer membrane autotransporter protein
MKWSNKTSFTPSLRADYAWIRDKSYGETGAGTLNLNVGTNRTEQFIVAADGKFTHALSDRSTLTANLGVGYDLINDQASIASTMAGTPTVAFATKGIDSSPWVLHGGAGMVYRADERTEVTARYDVEGREDFTNQTASVKVRWAF